MTEIAYVEAELRAFAKQWTDVAEPLNEGDPRRYVWEQRAAWAVSLAEMLRVERETLREHVEMLKRAAILTGVTDLVGEGIGVLDILTRER